MDFFFVALVKPEFLLRRFECSRAVAIDTTHKYTSGFDLGIKAAAAATEIDDNAQ